MRLRKLFESSCLPKDELMRLLLHPPYSIHTCTCATELGFQREKKKPNFDLVIISMTQNNIIFYNLDVSETACVRLMHVELTFESSICNLSSRKKYSWNISFTC
jgi:hypothetical protein